jgi:hypothetical protein
VRRGLTESAVDCSIDTWTETTTSARQRRTGYRDDRLPRIQRQVARINPRNYHPQRVGDNHTSASDPKRERPSCDESSSSRVNGSRIRYMDRRQTTRAGEQLCRIRSLRSIQMTVHNLVTDNVQPIDWSLKQSGRTHTLADGRIVVGIRERGRHIQVQTSGGAWHTANDMNLFMVETRCSVRERR